MEEKLVVRIEAKYGDSRAEEMVEIEEVHDRMAVGRKLLKAIWKVVKKVLP